MGEHLRAPRAGLRAAGGAPGSLLQAARAGTRSDRGARSPASPALPLCPGGPIALPSAGIAHSAPGAHAVPELAPEPARAGPGTRGCVWVCVWGGTRRVVSRPEGVPSDTQLSGRAPRRPNPPASRGLSPDSPIPAGPGPAGRPPGALFSRAFFFFCFSGEVVLSVWGSRVDRFELQRSRRGELCSPPGGLGGRRWPVQPGAAHRTTRQLGGPALDGAGPWGRQPSASPERSWEGQDGFWLRGSLSFAEGSEGSPVASLHFCPSTHTFQRHFP